MSTALPAFLAAPRQQAEDDNRDGQIDVWASIQEAKKNNPLELPPPYVHPMLKRSASFLSQKSLEICTESLGSETGSDGFSDNDNHLTSVSDNESEAGDDMDEQELPCNDVEGKELEAVNYHCSSNTWFLPRSFPPPLPSISRRDGPCLQMRLRRGSGRIVVDAVPVPSQNYLHCERQNGRLLLSFVETSFEEIYPNVVDRPYEDVDGMEMEEEIEEETEHRDTEEVEDEEEVKVVDQGTTEVKLSWETQPQIDGDIEKAFEENNWDENGEPSATPILAAGARDVAKSIGNEREGSGSGQSETETKQLFIGKKMMKRKELVYQVRCSQNQRPVFVWEPCYITIT